MCACVFFRIAHARGNHGLVHETSLHFACMHSLCLGKCHRCGAAFGCLSGAILSAIAPDSHPCVEQALLELEAATNRISTFELSMSRLYVCP